MSDTQRLKTIVEEEVRARLAKEYGQPFRKADLKVGVKADGSPAVREFDAVSADDSIVASIKASSWKTSGGNAPAGKTSSFYVELYFLGLIGPRAKKMLVFTDARARDGFAKVCDGKIAADIDLVPFKLSPRTQREAEEVQRAASREIRTSKTRKR